MKGVVSKQAYQHIEDMADELRRVLDGPLPEGAKGYVLREDLKGLLVQAEECAGSVRHLENELAKERTINNMLTDAMTRAGLSLRLEQAEND